MKWVTYGVIVVWLGAALAGLAYFSQLRLVMFDPAMELLSRAQSMQFDAQVAEVFAERHGNLANTAFLIEQSGCRCAFAARPHIAKVGKMLREQHYATREVVLDEHRYLEEVLPATPALVIFDEQGDLTFLGPYSEGALCTGNNGFAERFLTAQLSKTIPGATVINDAKGCYCHT